MTYDNIWRALDESGINKSILSEASKAIESGAWKIFAILLLMNKPELITKILANDQVFYSNPDAKLPFSKAHLQTIFPRPIDAEEFFHYQWTVSALVFRNHGFLQQIGRKVILPILREESLKTGGFHACIALRFTTISTCSVQFLIREEVVESYQKISCSTANSKSQKFVRKMMVRRDGGQEHKNETNEQGNEHRNLTILRGLKYPNIVQLLYSFEYRQNISLIFPLAEYGSLDVLLE